MRTSYRAGWLCYKTSDRLHRVLKPGQHVLHRRGYFASVVCLGQSGRNLIAVLNHAVHTINMLAVFLIVAIINVLAFGWLGSYVASQCGRDPSEGALFGALLGPVGVLIVALLPRGAQSHRSTATGSRVTNSPTLAEQVEREETDDAAIAFLDDK